jgi:hypothetical protein
MGRDARRLRQRTQATVAACLMLAAAGLSLAGAGESYAKTASQHQQSRKGSSCAHPQPLRPSFCRPEQA